VVGPYHSYSSYGGLVAGGDNTISGVGSVVTGGSGNEAFANYSAILGGFENVTGDIFQESHLLGEGSTISGGRLNTTTKGVAASISGGLLNETLGNQSSVSGGSGNKALESHSSVSGGRNRSAHDLYDWVAGELFQDE